jgi:hypothetical protein
MSSPSNTLQAALEQQLEPDAREWLATAIRAAAGGDTSLTAATRMPARLGRARFSEGQRRQLAAAAPGVVFEKWTLVDGARALLLLTLADATSDAAFSEAAAAWHEQGDAGEQASWLRALPLLPHPERFLQIAIDSCRTNIVPLFEAIACDNPYPERHFPTPQFNQLVLKTVFVGLPLARVVGLERRRNGELTRMASDFADERRAAGRPVPSDLHLALSNVPPEPQS